MDIDDGFSIGPRPEPLSYTNANLALSISRLNNRIATWTAEMVYGMWSPDYCSADARLAAKRFMEDIQPILDGIKANASK